MPIQFSTFPQTEPPEPFVFDIVEVFRSCDAEIMPAATEKGFGSDKVLQLLRPGLVRLGFQVESGKSSSGKIDRPVFFGREGKATLRYQVDAYHPKLRCGFEVEAGRGMQGGAFYRDLIQAMVMTGIDHLVIALLNAYHFAKTHSKDFEKAESIAQAVYGHSRVTLPFKLTLIGYGPEG